MLRRLGTRIRLQDLPFRMLVVLLETPGEVVSREELRNRLWGDGTFVEFDNNLRVAAAKLREALRDSATQPQYLETVARRGYRFAAPVEIVDTLASESRTHIQTDPELAPLPQAKQNPVLPPETPAQESARKDSWRTPLLIAATVLLVAALSYAVWLRMRPPLLAKGDTVAVGNIQNETGDASLDDALSLPFHIKMEESPYLHTVSHDQFAQKALQLKQDATTTADAELKACASLGGKLLLYGRLIHSGSEFAVRLVAQNCQDHHELASTEASATTAPGLLKALDDASDHLRLRLGEPSSTLNRFDVPLTQATTDSLAALRAFHTGEQMHLAGHDLDARESYKLAIDLDPKFALAYLQLGRSYSNTGEVSLSRAYYQKAFDLRERTSDREKLYIATSYYSYATGEVERAISAYQLWISIYPNDVVPANNIATEYIKLGEADKAVASARRAIELEPSLPVPYSTLAEALLIAGDNSTLSVLCHDKARIQSGGMGYYIACHQLSIITGDIALQKQLEQRAQNTPTETTLLNNNAEDDAYHGRIHSAEQLFQRSAASGRAHGFTELTSIYILNDACIRAEFGTPSAVPAMIEDAMSHSNKGADILTAAAIAWAMLGNEAKTNELAAQAHALSPTDTMMNRSELPVAYAIAALKSGRPHEALAQLARARPYDLSSTLELMPAYYRGLAFLGLKDRSAAQAEFESVLAHKTIHALSIYVVLSQMELARIYAAEGQTARAKALAADLEQTWAQADPDFIPRKTLRAAFPAP